MRVGNRPTPELGTHRDDFPSPVQHLTEVFVGDAEQVDPQLRSRVGRTEEPLGSCTQLRVDGRVRAGSKPYEHRCADGDKHHREYHPERHGEPDPDRQLHGSPRTR